MHTYQQLPLEPGKVITLSTELKEPSPFYFGYKTQEALVEILKQQSFDKLFILTEKNIHSIFEEAFFAHLTAHFPDHTLNFLPTGESSKYFPILDEICNQLVEQSVSKKSILLAFGGGATCNLVGMAAGLIYRGIRYIEVPTTFTGQTDSSLSNKQAVNGKFGKNHFGFYYAPLFIWSDTQYLNSEPPSSTRSGIIEGVKNGLIANPPFLTSLYENLRPALDFSEEERYNLAYNIIQSKLDILRKDPSEKVYGLILEYGHTFGHAIEFLQKGKMSHGESVSYGMLIAARLSHRLGFISQTDVDLHDDVIKNKVGFNQPFPSSITTDALMSAMIADNKKTGNNLRFVILKSIGECHNPEGDYLCSIDLKIVRQVVDAFING